MRDEEFVSRLRALRDRFAGALAEAKPKQERYDALRREMCALVGDQRVETWEDSQRGMRGAFGPPCWTGKVTNDLREDLWQLVRDYAQEMVDEVMPGVKDGPRRG